MRGRAAGLRRRRRDVEKEDLSETGEQIARRWLPAIIEGLARYTDEKQRTAIMELCGASCGHHDLQRLRHLKAQAKDERELLALINEYIPWCGTWEWEGDSIHTVCAGCGCPLARDFGLELSPTFCLCSRGWVKATFSEAFDREVDVDLLKAIGQGDERCEFVVQVGGGAA
jgi:predicted hydrocarbon binding protein